MMNDAICFIFFSPRETWSQASRHVPMLDVLIGTKSSKNCKPRRKAKLLYFIAALPNWARFWSSNVTNLGLTIAKKTSKYIWNNLEGIIVNFVVYILIYDHHYLLNKVHRWHWLNATTEFLFLKSNLSSSQKSWVRAVRGNLLTLPTFKQNGKYFEQSGIDSHPWTDFRIFWL